MIDRQAETGRFKAFLDHQAHPGWLLVFYGLPGLGKSTLLSSFHEHLTPGDLAVDLDFDQNQDWIDTLFLYQALDRALDRAKLPAEILAAYQAGVKAVDQKVAALQSSARLSIEALNSTVRDITLNVTIAADLHRQVLLESTAERTGLWLEAARQADRRWVIFLDHWDARFKPEAARMYQGVCEHLLRQAAAVLPGFRAVVACGSPIWAAGLAEAAEQFPLDPLGEQDSLALLALEKVDALPVRQFISSHAGGNPLLLTLAAGLWKTHPQADLSFLEQELPIEENTKWILNQYNLDKLDPRSAAGFDYGVILDWFNQALLGALCRKEQLDGRNEEQWYAGFIQYPFVEKAPRRPGWHQLVHLVRRVKVNYLWQQTRPKFCSLHRSALEIFEPPGGSLAG